MTDTTTSSSTPTAQTVAGDLGTIATDVAETTAAVTTASWQTALFGFLTALPMICTIILRVMNLFKNNKAASMLSAFGSALDKADAAQSQQETQDAAEDLANDIHHLGR